MVPGLRGGLYRQQTKTVVIVACTMDRLVGWMDGRNELAKVFAFMEWARMEWMDVNARAKLPYRYPIADLCVRLFLNGGRDKMAKCGWEGLILGKRGARWDGVYYKYLFVSKTRRGEDRS
jgi:hypothetical protein